MNLVQIRFLVKTEHWLFTLFFSLCQNGIWWANEFPPPSRAAVTASVFPIQSQLCTSNGGFWWRNGSRVASSDVIEGRETHQCVWSRADRDPSVQMWLETNLPNVVANCFAKIWFTRFVTVQMTKEPSGFNLGGLKTWFCLAVCKWAKRRNRWKMVGKSKKSSFL